MKKITLSLALVLAVSLGANEVSKCLGCHGTKFEKSALRKSKIVKDMNTTSIVYSLRGYRDGTYGGPMKGIMKGQVKDLNNSQIASIAKLIKGK